MFAFFKPKSEISYVCLKIEQIEYKNTRYKICGWDRMWVATVQKYTRCKEDGEPFELFNSFDNPNDWSVSWKYESGRTIFESLSWEEYSILRKVLEDKFQGDKSLLEQTESARVIRDVKLAMEKK